MNSQTIKTLVSVFIIIMLQLQASSQTVESENREEKAMLELQGKKVLMVVAPTQFQDDEFSKSYTLLKQKGVAVTVASLKKGALAGMFGATATADGLVSDYKANEFDGIIFVGGAGASVFFDNSSALALARDAGAAENIKVIGAICIAPAILANAGVLKGKKATCFPSVANTLTAKGAIVDTSRDVVIDGKFVTAAGPKAAAAFAAAILQALQQ